MDGKSKPATSANHEPDGMDWELSEETAKIVNKVPNEEATDVYEGDDLDIESFSFDSDPEEDEANSLESNLGPVLSKAFDIKVLKTAIEASEHTLDLVVGKVVVMVGGKTGMSYVTLGNH